MGKISGGGTPSRGRREYWEGGTIPWVKISDISSRYIEKTSEKITQRGLDNSSAKIFPKGTILISIFATLGELGILKIDAACNQALAGIRLVGDDIERNYLYYYLKTLRKHFESIGRGVAQNNINLTILRNTKILLPPRETQQKIAEILEKADGTKGLREQSTELVKQLLQSIFSRIFGDPSKNPKGWKSVLLGDVCEKIQDGTHFSPKEQTGDVPYITAKNIRPWGIDLTDVTYIPREVHKEIYIRCDPRKGDVIYIKDGVTAGLAKVNTLDFEFSMLSSIAMIRPKPQVLDPYYLEYYLNHANVFRRIMKRKAGSAITRLILKEIRKIRIHLPPYDIQQEFSQIVGKIEEVTKAQEQSRHNIDNLFSALMQRAVIGELTT